LVACTLREGKRIDFVKNNRTVLIGLILSATIECRGALVSDLLKEADAVVVGTPVALTTATDGVEISVAVDSWLVGSRASSPSVIHVRWRGLNGQQQQTLALPSVEKRGVWFLKDVGGLYSPIRLASAPTYYPGLRDLYLEAGVGSGCPSAFAYTAADSSADKIALVLACGAAFETDTRSSFGGAILASCSPDASARVKSASTYLAQMPLPRQKTLGITCLISLRDLSGLDLLNQHLQELNDQDVVRFVAQRVGWVTADAPWINGLGRVAVNPHANGILLMFAAMTLAEIHTVDTLPWFDKLLDRSERDAQRWAIMGLVQFINGYPIRTPENFKDMSAMKPSPTPYSADTTWRNHVPQESASDADFQAAASYWKAWLRAQRLVQ
jgi:hypothetical protein